MRIQKYKKQDEESENNIDDYVLRAKKEREEKDNRSSRRLSQYHSRRWFGIRLGLIIGFCFGITSEFVNIYLLSDLWLFSPPFGALGNVVFYGALIVLISWVLSIPDDTFSGISLGCLAGIAAIEIRSWFIPSASSILEMIFDPTLVLFVLISISFMGLLLIPIMILWRTSIETLYDMQEENWMHWNRIRYSLGIIVLALIAGSFLMIPSDTRIILRNMNSMIEDGLSAYNESQLPAPLRTESTKWILDYQGEDYYLELNPNDLTEDKSSIRSILGRSGLGGNVSVAVHFKGGGTIVCTYQSPRIRPYCR